MGNITEAPKRTGHVRTNSPVYKLETKEIEGKVHKPAVFYVLGRSGFSHAGVDMAPTFIGRITAGALKNPF